MADWMGMCRSAKKPAPRTFAREEIEIHNKVNDIWIVISGKVYDVTLFMKYHPGGEGILMTCAGKDATIMYNKYHSYVQAEAMMGPFCLGTYDPRKKYEAPPAYMPLNTGPESKFSMSKPEVRQPSKTPWKKGDPLTKEIIKQRCTAEELWLIIYGKVYDVTHFCSNHPGGGDILLNNGGKDCSTAFDKYHSAKAKEQLMQYYIGDVKNASGSLLTATSTAPPKFGKKPSGGAGYAPPGEPVQKLKITTHEPISHDTVRIVVESSNTDRIPLCGHIRLHDTAGNSRSYTPVNDANNTLEFIIKKYSSGVLSTYLHGLKEGEMLELSGPFRGRFQQLEKTRKYVLLAGGTGIAPFVPLLKKVANDENLSAEVLYSNRTRGDVLLPLDEFVSSRVKVRHFFTQEKEGSQEKDGRHETFGKITADAFNDVTAAADDVQAVLCGPPAFNEDLGKMLTSLGYAVTKLE